jgi:ribosomal-protein-alanine N-acetyltransferase
VARLRADDRSLRIVGRIRTDRLELVPATLELAENEMDDRPRFAEALGAEVPDTWPPEILAEALPLFRDRLREDPERTGWLGWYALLGTGRGRVLVGSVGFTGPPDLSGCVEIGYSMVPSYQGRGIATEMVRALCGWALRQPGVSGIEAETTRANAASIRVLEKAGFMRIEPGPGVPGDSVRFRRA